MRVSTLRFVPPALIAGIFVTAVPCSSQTVSAALTNPRPTMDQVVDQAIARERALIDMLKMRTPLIEPICKTVSSIPNGGLLQFKTTISLGEWTSGRP